MRGFGEDARADAVVGVDHPDQVIADFERHTHDRAQVVGNDAFVPAEARVFLGVGGQDGFARVR